MDDLISKRAAIDAIVGILTHGQALECSRRISALPPAQPKNEEQTAKSAQNVTNDELISRKAAVDALGKMMPKPYTLDGSHPADEEIFRAQEIFADCIKTIEILPPAQPEITECQNCQVYEIAKNGVNGWCPKMGRCMDMYDYCSYAERQEG